MRHATVRLLSLLALTWQLACVSSGKEKEVKEPPQITQDMPLDEALDGAISFGGETMESVKKLVTRRKEWAKARPILEKELKRGTDDRTDDEYSNAASLYFASKKAPETSFVLTLLKAERPLSRRIGFYLAAKWPSKAMADMIESHMTAMVAANEEESYIVPELAQAAAANNMTSMYSLMKIGLMTYGSDDFAKAMLVFNPTGASDDFGYYLAKANLEDLRQLNQESVNIYTCLIIFRHLLAYPMSLSHPAYENLFYYAVSRNQMLADMAQAVLERQMARHRSAMAAILARQKLEVQIAFIEANRRSPSANVGLFFKELRNTTAHREVVDELTAVRR